MFIAGWNPLKWLDEGLGYSDNCIFCFFVVSKFYARTIGLKLFRKNIGSNVAVKSETGLLFLRDKRKIPAN